MKIVRNFIVLAFVITETMMFFNLVRFGLPLFQHRSLRFNLHVFCAWMLQTMAIFRRNFMNYPRYLRTRYGVHKLTCVAGDFCCGGALDQSASEH